MTSLFARAERDSPGLFGNPGWQPGTPGTFAVIVGVSAYPYLAGGSDHRAGDESFDLGQLDVSAATAWSFFRWFADRYEYPAAPPARCWLLLSPTAAELPALGSGDVAGQGAAPATLANCERALQLWSAAMSELGEDAAAASRGIFFFSGHGLEVTQDCQILLPADYLSPPGRSVNAAISTANLVKGLASSRVTSHFLFADACRADVPALREYVVEGRQILNVRTTAATNPDALAGVLYAAGPGTATWQPRSLDRGLSLFGTALLEGLDGAAGVERHGCDGRHCEIHFYPLQSFVKARMAELLTAFASPEKARVRQGGSPPDGGITLVPDLPAAGPPPAPDRILAARYDIAHTGLAVAPRTMGFDRGHELFGSERMTDIWFRAAAYDLGTGAQVPHRDLVIREVRRSSDTRAYRIALQLPAAPHGHWLTFTDPRGHHFATSLAGDEGHRPIYELSLDFEFDDAAAYVSSRWVSALEAGISPLTPGLLGRIAAAWAAYEQQNVAVAVRELDAGDLRDIVTGQHESSLAATVAAVLLRRARRLDLAPARWLTSLTERFPENLDARVLRAAWDRPGPHPYAEVAAGLPRLAEVVELAWAARPRQPRLRRAMRWHRPGGLFAVYASPTEPLGADLVR